MKGRIIIAILVLTLMISSVFAGAENINTKNIKLKPETLLMSGAKLTIFVDYVTNDYKLGLDELDWVLPDGESPEWWYTIRVYDGHDIDQKIEHKSGTSTFTWDADKTHDFEDCTSDTELTIQIELWDNDNFGLTNEQADIRNRSGGQKTFVANYDLEINTLSNKYENFVDQGDGWYLLTGELDGTAGHDNDDNDANMRIRITDNLEDMQVTLELKESLENNNVAPGTELTFIATVQGGLPPFEYYLYPHGAGETEHLTSDERQVEIKHTFLDSDHGTSWGPALINVADDQGCADSDSLDKPIIVNNRPNKPSKPTETRLFGVSTYQTTATDSDGDSLEYQWEINDVAQSWSGYSYYESEERAKKVRVRVRDAPLQESDFEIGLTSSWSDSYTETKNIDHSLFFNLFEMLKARFPFLAFFNGFNRGLI
jgi:hypothetical protein